MYVFIYVYIYIYINIYHIGRRFVGLQDHQICALRSRVKSRYLFSEICAWLYDVYIYIYIYSVYLSTVTSTFEYRNWYFILPPGPRGLANNFQRIFQGGILKHLSVCDVSVFAVGLREGGFGAGGGCVCVCCRPSGTERSAVVTVVVSVVVSVV